MSGLLGPKKGKHSSIPMPAALGALEWAFTRSWRVRSGLNEFAYLCDVLDRLTDLSSESELYDLLLDQ